MFSANGYQLMSDEQRVSSYLHFPGIFYCSCNCMCWVAWRRSPVPPHVCHYSMLSVACVFSGQFCMRVKRRDSDNLVLFCLFSANGYQLMSDEQLVSSYLHFPGMFYCSCNCICWVAWRCSGTCKRLCNDMCVFLLRNTTPVQMATARSADTTKENTITTQTYTSTV